ncbi:uncharacterized protein LOC123523092 [Mercenaria mercenaria]|uniref:uncharacterized protein LOC123523092 n=1 Tax=Mercenaria mercenaria TaxID=6596 RepID=UPI00234F96F0|nr:uncharacterized protein LOC123523092 [Mercenaria mercenaria]
MNEDNKARTQYRGQLSALDDTDEFNCSSGNILENFPYLRNDGLGQMQVHQSTGQNTQSTIKAELPSFKSFIKKEDDSNKFIIAGSTTYSDFSHSFTTVFTTPVGAAPIEINTTNQTCVPVLEKSLLLEQLNISRLTNVETAGQRSYPKTLSHHMTESVGETSNYSTQFSSSEQQASSGTLEQNVVSNITLNSTANEQSNTRDSKDFISIISTNGQSDTTDKKDDLNVNLNKVESSLADEQTTRTISAGPKIQFLLKGKLGHDIDAIVKSVRQIMIEPVDVEERLIEDFVYNYPKEIKTEPVDEPAMSASASQSMYVSPTSSVSISTSGQFTQPSWSGFQKDTLLSESSVKEVCAYSTNTVTKSLAYVDSETTTVSSEVVIKPVVRYTEPSIAEIRASVLGSSERTRNIRGLDAGSENGEKDVEEDIADRNEDSLTSDEIFESEIIQKKSDENQYGAMLRKFTSMKKTNETIENTPTAKKGGRSDPSNPFALTSPSFNDSTAKALMTTTQTSTATVIMISIMSIGSRAKLIPKIVNSKAAEGGLISIINPVEPPGNKSTQVNNEDQISSERTSIMSKLRREKWHSSEDSATANTNIDRLDINIKIDDNQYIGHGENKRWLCKICPKSYTTKHNLVAHILDHGDIKPHLCLVCEKYFKQLSHLNTHMLTHDNVKPYVCTLCDKGFTQISHLKRHETVHMGSKPYICDICNRGFAFPSELRLHKDKHMSGSEKCTDCDKEFDTWNELQEHMVAFSHCGDLQCKHCDRIFRFPSQLRDHMMSHAGSRPYICTECGMDFMKEHHLKSHQFTHTGLRPYVCPDCGRSFNQKANMQRHMLIHNAQRAYRCEVCGKTFTQPQTLKAHMVVHSDTKPYKCNICGKQFGRQHNLQGHMHIHSDSKPYSCSICQSSFTLKGNLNRHKKVKHGLDESTEVMEEDAVNFLSTISDRARESYSNYVPSDNEIDPDSRDGLPSPESRSSKKGRKSVPRKHVSRQLYDDDDGDMGSDFETERTITYSDEERENERTSGITSKYFESSETGSASSRRKRKRGAVYHVEYDDESDGHNDSDVKEIQDNQSFETNDTTLNATSETRSTRKRKKKDFGEDFTETGLEMETSARSQKKKSAKLDNIIASKFSA